jgi:hypothetical protein
MKNLPLKLAGIISFSAALIHTFLGERNIVEPLTNSNINSQIVAELTGIWHMTTLFLFGTAYILLKSGFRGYRKLNQNLLKTIGWAYLISSIPSIAASIKNELLAPQFILLMPIGFLIHWNITLYKSNR